MTTKRATPTKPWPPVFIYTEEALGSAYEHALVRAAVDQRRAPIIVAGIDEDDEIARGLAALVGSAGGQLWTLPAMGSPVLAAYKDAFMVGMTRSAVEGRDYFVLTWPEWKARIGESQNAKRK